MNYKVYILFSENLRKYYVGYTAMSVAERLSRHLMEHKGFTSNAKDWKCVWFEEIENKTNAIQKERQIKKRGAGRFLKDCDEGKKSG